jgi:NAD(P)-dependent dehydrogenase (short-subunit alcohol dehydrogenase family)
MAADGAGGLEGKVCLVTGAASGIGQGTARVFAAEGARLVLVDVNADGLTATARELGPAVEASHAADLSDEPSVAAFFEQAVAPLGRLDGLVCAHGFLDLADGFLESHETAVFERTLGINLYSCYFMTREAIPWMKAAGRGSIVLISSLAALRTPSSIAYGATKGALNAMGKTISGQYAGSGIRCNVICPGAIQTPMLDRVQSRRASGKPAGSGSHIGHAGEPEDVGNLAAFLCSDRSGYITATVQTVDGGVAQH